jgi:hypothetical protein
LLSVSSYRFNGLVYHRDETPNRIAAHSCRTLKLRNPGPRNIKGFLGINTIAAEITPAQALSGALLDTILVRCYFPLAVSADFA